MTGPRIERLCLYGTSDQVQRSLSRGGGCRWYAGEMKNGRATITISRTAPEDVRVRQIYISVDGRTVTELLYGQSFTTDIEPGSHRLRANNTLVWKTITCALEAGEHARFRVVNRPGFGTYLMLGLLGTGPIYLTFARDPDVGA